MTDVVHRPDLNVHEGSRMMISRAAQIIVHFALLFSVGLIAQRSAPVWVRPGIDDQINLICQRPNKCIVGVGAKFHQWDTSSPRQLRSWNLKDAVSWNTFYDAKHDEFIAFATYNQVYRFAENSQGIWQVVDTLFSKTKFSTLSLTRNVNSSATTLAVLDEDSLRKPVIAVYAFPDVSTTIYEAHHRREFPAATLVDCDSAHSVMIASYPDGLVDVHSITNRSFLFSVATSPGYASSLTLSPSGKSFVAIYDSMLVIASTVNSTDPIWRLARRTRRGYIILSRFVSDSRCIAVTDSGTIIQCDLDSHEVNEYTVPCNVNFNAAALTNSHSEIILTDRNNAISRIDIDTKHVVEIVQPPAAQWVKALVMDDDRGIIYTGFENGAVLRLSVSSGSEISDRFSIPNVYPYSSNPRISGMCLSDKSELLCVASYNLAKIWDTSTDSAYSSLVGQTSSSSVESYYVREFSYPEFVEENGFKFLVQKENLRYSGVRGYYQDIDIISAPILVQNGLIDTLTYDDPIDYRLRWSFYDGVFGLGDIGSSSGAFAMSRMKNYSAVEYGQGNLTKVFGAHGGAGLSYINNDSSFAVHGNSGFAFGQMETSICTALHDTLWLYHLPDGQKLRTIVKPGKWRVLALRDQDRRVVCYDSSGRQFVVIDLQRDSVVMRYDSMPSTPTAMKVSDDGRSLVAGFADGSVMMFRGDGTVSTPDIVETESLSCFPMPVGDVLHVRVSEGLINSPYSIIAVTGSIVLDGRIVSANTTIDTRHLEAGVYLLRCNNQTRSFALIH